LKTDSIIQTHKRMNYFLLFVVAILSLLATIYFDLSETMKILTSTPLVGALLVALFQLLRDDERFIRDSIIQDREHAFSIAATSHMSEVVFDKHVKFSEDYLAQVRKVIGIMWSSTVTKESGKMEIVELLVIRDRYQLWLSNEMAMEISHIEDELFQMNDKLRNSYKQNDDTSLDLSEKIKDAESSAAVILELVELEKEKGGQIIGQLQDILGVSKLTQMRDALLLEKQEGEKK